jgi:hypothetical protein
MTTKREKRYKMKNGFIFIVALIFLTIDQQSLGQQVFEVGIPSNTLNYYVAEKQNNSNWCWAASIKMIFKYYGVTISQEDIVRRSYGTDPYGRLPNWQGSYQVITANLNNWSIDKSGRMYSVRSSLNFGAPTPTYLIDELSNKRPVLVGYKSSVSGGHAVIITAVSYIMSFNGPIIQTITVRDPWPSAQNINNKGKVVYTGSSFASKIMHHWYVRVY